MSTFPLSVIRPGRHLIGAAVSDASGTWAAFTAHEGCAAGQACILPPRFQRDLSVPGADTWRDGAGLIRQIDPRQAGSFGGFTRPGLTYVWRPGQVQPDVTAAEVHARITLRVPAALTPGAQGLLVTQGTLVTEAMLRPLFGLDAQAALEEMGPLLPDVQRPADLIACSAAGLVRLLEALPGTPQVRAPSRNLVEAGAQLMRRRPRRGQTLRAVLLRGGEQYAAVECQLSAPGRSRFHPEVALALNTLSGQPGDVLAVLACDDPRAAAPVDLVGRAGVLHLTE